MMRLGDELPEPAGEMLRLVDHVEHHLANAFNLLRQDLRRTVACGHLRIAVAIAAQLARQHVVGEAADQFAAVRRAEADRVVDGVFQRIAFVRESRRNIENIARLHLFIDNGVERLHL